MAGPVPAIHVFGAGRRGCPGQALARPVKRFRNTRRIIMSKYTDIGVETHGHVGLIEIQRPPLNFFDISLINQIADALEEFDKDIEIRASVLAAQGKAFCAGANFSDPARQAQEEAEAKAEAKG